MKQAFESIEIGVARATIMLRLIKMAANIPVLVVVLMAAMGASSASAQEVAAEGPVAQPTGAQIQWEKRIPGAYSWDQNNTLWNELNQSVRTFFGNATGDYRRRPTAKDLEVLQSRDDPRAWHARVQPSQLKEWENVKAARSRNYSLPSKQEWALIATQFFDPLATGTWSRGTILNGRWELYEFDESGRMHNAFVTPVHSTEIIAAAMVHHTCPDTLVPSFSSDPETARQVLLRDLACSKSAVTIFFKRPFDIKPEITQALAKQASKGIIEACQAKPMRQVGTDAHKRWVAKFGELPPCRVRYKVVTLNEAPATSRTPPPSGH